MYCPSISPLVVNDPQRRSWHGQHPKPHRFRRVTRSFRGLQHALLAVADGTLRFCSALEDALPGARAQQCRVHTALLRVSHGAGPTIRTTLCPPKPKELFNAILTRVSRGLFGT